MCVKDYYDGIADYYHYISVDWESDIKEESLQIDSIIREIWGESVHKILDVACGIGTQSIGLAALGYLITGTDIAKKAITRARQEAKKQNLDILFYVSDMRQLGMIQESIYDLVIACDNAIPHLLSDHDTLNAFNEIYARLRDGGGCLISIRDYKTMQLGDTLFYPRTIHSVEDGYIVLFDIWHFKEDIYEMSTYVVEDDRSECKQIKSAVHRTFYRCVSTIHLENLMRQVGFTDVRTLHGRYFQPVIIGTKPISSVTI